MNLSDDMDIDAMVNNPFRDIDQREKPVIAEHPEIRETAAPQPEATTVGEDEQSLMERNQPLELRVRSLEKNEYSSRLKIEDVKRIIEHQNERIRLLEEDLALLRKEKNGRDD